MRDRIYDILNEFKVAGVALVIVATVWSYARAQQFQQQADQIHFWPSIAPSMRSEGESVAGLDLDPADQ